jgi:hypothetical protein
MKAWGVRAVTTLCAWLLTAPFARLAGAEPSSADKSLATSLFKEGRALVDQGHVSEGCRKLEESQRLDPGGGTLLNLALCHEKEGRTATAWAEFTEALGIAKHDDRPQRVEFARTHIAQLEISLSRVTVQVPHAAEVPDLEIKRDGSMIGHAAWGSAMPVDPGDHLIEATAPGKVAWKQTVTVGPKGDGKTVVVPMLDDAPPAQANAGGLTTSPGSPPAAGSLPGSGGGADVAGSSDTTLVSRRSSGPGAAAWIVLGVGVAAAGAGTYFALHAVALKRDADRDCPNDLCMGHGLQENSDAITSANLATAGFAVGLIGVGVGTFLLATSSHPATVPTGRIAPALAGVDLALGDKATKLTVSGRF